MSVVRSTYFRLRPYLPQVRCEFNGAIVKRPARPSNRYRPDFEQACVDAIQAFVTPGDSVTIVGGGVGVTAVHAARQVGPDGHVTVFEASREYASQVQETAALNGVADRVSVECAVVGARIKTRGTAVTDRVVYPAGLPKSDYLEIDIEGGECFVLQQLEAPISEIIAVEAHPEHGCGRRVITGELERIGYPIVSVIDGESEADLVVGSQQELAEAELCQVGGLA